MGTFRARFTLQTTTGNVFQTVGSGNDAEHTYSNSTAGQELIAKSGSIIYGLIGNCFFLDGSLVGISFDTLPSGFSITSLLSLSSPGSGGTPDIAIAEAFKDFVGQAGVSIVTLTWGSYGPVTARADNSIDTNQINVSNISFESLIDLIIFLKIDCSITPVAGVGDFSGNAAGAFDFIDVTGSYTAEIFTWTLAQTTNQIRISSLDLNPDLTNVVSVTFVYTGPDGGTRTVIVTTFTILLANLLVLNTPSTCGAMGSTQVIVNFTTFSVILETVVLT